MLLPKIKLQLIVILIAIILCGLFFYIINQPSTETNTDRKKSYWECASNLQNEKEDYALCDIQLNKCVEANQAESMRKYFNK